ncbi:xanthine dehydrogenase/oxidase-like [Haliotis rufescens]|uniref:xanthine dehydrogenase/oxidase-like n=1 Tax=Haliotis rufescens TaxID=6454 RepID=UPI00201F12D1|nr:xanthine dehydrogenase/oxidase-like [Haliotis rufescens]
MSGTELVFFVNGAKVVEAHPDPELTLLQYLRKHLRLTGSKLGCGEGGCGACTVMVSRYDRHTDAISHYSVNACLAPVCSLHGLSVTTVEGIGSTRTRLHPVQEQLAKSHGSQCGFCTPGIVMSMYTLLRNNPWPTREQIEDNFDGNLCRCTGYRPILQGYNYFAKDGCGMGENCCRLNSGAESKGVQNGTTHGDTGNSDAMTNRHMAYDPSQEPIFPPELKTKSEFYQSSLKFTSDRVTWYRPATLVELLDVKANFPNAKLVIGNSEIGIETKFKNMHYPVLVAAGNIAELNLVEHTTTGITLGASVTLATMDEVLRKAVKELPECKTRSFSAFVEMLRWFAGHQIRNVASIGGNIMTASPISDLIPLLMAAGATLTVGSKGEPQRTVRMDGDFFKGYRKIAVHPKEILLSVHLPFTSEDEYFSGFKQAHRKDDDISIVNAGMMVRFKPGTNVVDDAILAYGGMAPTTVLAKRAMEGLKQQTWNDVLLERTCEHLASDLPLSPGSPGGMVEYRRTLTTSFFFKFYTDVTQRLQQTPGGIVPSDAVKDIERRVSEGVQLYEAVPDDQDPTDAVGRPLVHTSALQQTTGEAVYIDDMPMIDGELYAAFVFSTKAHAKILSVDASEALSMPGVVDFVSFKDIPALTTFGVASQDEMEIFASKEVIFQGQIIACILGETQIEAQRAAKTVKVEYEDLTPIITIEQAIQENSFFNPNISVTNGDLDLGFRESDHVIEDELRIGPQEHFYLETNVAAARPTNEEGGMEIISSTQFPSGIQHQVAAALGVPANKIVSRVKRIGGGFGGKESITSFVALPVAVAAAKVNRPVRCMLDRDEDMVLTGGRHAFLARYKAGFSSAGRLQALDVKLYANSGCTLDLTVGVLTRAVLTVENAYNVPNIRVVGYKCKTNIPTATAFRGFGSPQAMLVSETLMDAVADVVGKEQHEVRHINLYHEGDLTYYGQEVKGANIRKLWEDCMVQSQYTRREKEVEDFNKAHRWKKRGIALIPTKYALSYPKPTNFFNQACALVTAYMDGSVLVAHCGTEMGQGLHTKMIQVASRALGIPASQVYINDTCTDKIHMTCPTAASTGSDLNGGAVQNACEILAKRLSPYRKAKPEGTFKDWVNTAYFDRVHLSAAGYHRTEGLDHDPVTNKGRMFNYFTCGVACSEVEIDCLTGDHQVLQTDIVMDVGKSLNPAIDIGQIEGAFMQGYGLYCLEQHKTNPSGSILTRGPGTYKIPGFRNIPVKLNVTLLKDSVNPRAVYSSKGIGEPPLFLASSVFFAMKNAIKSARLDAGESRAFQLDSPATPEKIRMACKDRFTKQFPAADEGSYKPWYVEL